MAIFKKQGVWWVDYYASGQRKRERVGSSYKLAQDVLSKRKAEIAEGRYFPERRKQTITFKEMAEKYWAMHGQYLKSKSWRYMLVIVLKAIGDRQAGDITAGELQELYNQLREKTSVANAIRYMTLVKSIFSRCIEWSMFYGDNPTLKVKLGQVDNHRLRYLSVDEMQRLLAACSTTIYPFVVCALMTGMRRGEMLNLTWDNVDTEHRMIYILNSKSGKPREIPIASKLLEVFESIPGSHTGNVFNLSEPTLRFHFEKALRDSGITDFRIHDLRHTFASHFIMKTSNMPVLQQILGHASSKMTQRYAHLAKGHLISEMQLFDSTMPVQRLDFHADGHLYGHQPHDRPAVNVLK
jgi:integrase